MTAATPSENVESTPAGKVKSSRNSATAGQANKYEEARLAKKKQRRKAHRKTILRSNTNG